MLYRPQTGELKRQVSHTQSVGGRIGAGCRILAARTRWRLALVVLPLLFGCHSSSDVQATSAQGQQAESTVPSVSTAKTTPGMADPGAVASGKIPLTAVSAVQDVKRPVFDSENAFSLLLKQCEFGPRPLGSEAHEKTKEYLQQQMKQLADVTVTQTFSYRGLPVTNVVGIFYPAGATKPAKNPVLLLTHWDSRPIADGPGSSEARKNPPYAFGPKGWNRTTPIMAANDGASGTAVLLELAQMFKKQKPPVGVVILLDDGEDYGDFHANNGSGEGVELGSRYFAKHFKEDSRLGFPDFGILLDMVGGKELVFPVEKFSMDSAPGTMIKVFQAGKALGYKTAFRDDLEFSVEDDHIALIRAGMHVIDLIPFFGDSAPQGVPGYTYWHTLQDTSDKCSPNALRVVGDTVAEVLYNEKPTP